MSIISMLGKDIERVTHIEAENHQEFCDEMEQNHRDSNAWEEEDFDLFRIGKYNEAYVSRDNNGKVVGYILLDIRKCIEIVKIDAEKGERYASTIRSMLQHIFLMRKNINFICEDNRLEVHKILKSLGFKATEVQFEKFGPLVDGYLFERKKDMYRSKRRTSSRDF